MVNAGFLSATALEGESGGTTGDANTRLKEHSERESGRAWRVQSERGRGCFTSQQHPWRMLRERFLPSQIAADGCL